jgi:hypothetical protein
MSEGVSVQRRRACGVGRLRVERRSDHVESGICHWDGQRDDMERLPTGEHCCPMCHACQVYEAPEW